MKTRREFGRLILGGLATASAARALDWPQFRGPNQDDVSLEKGLMQDWPAGGPKLLWDATGTGNGYSTVSTAGDRVATCGEVNGQSSVVVLNAKDGSKAWVTPIGKTGKIGCCNAGGPRSAPTIDAKAGLLFAISQFGEVAALDWKDGKEVWKKHLVDDFGGVLPVWEYASAPVVDGDHLLLTVGSSKGVVMAVDKKSGKPVWFSSDLIDSGKNDMYSTLVIATIGGVKQYVQLTDEFIVGLNPADGKVLWKAERRGATANIPTPVIFENLVYVSSGYGVGCSAYEIKNQGDKWNATELWKNKAMVNHHGGVVRVGPNVYGHSDNKGWTCQEIKTGNVLWQDKSSFGKGSITYADGRFVLREEDKAGTLALIEANPAGYKEHGRFNPPSRSREMAWPHPVISNGKLYIRDEDHLLCFDVSAKA